jgi:hypothetical protein
MFGRDLLTFTNWSEETDIDEVLAIDNRTNEIKNHFTHTIPDAVKVIGEKKQIQSQYQDKDNNIMVHPLAAGTTVNVKKDGLLSKLEPRFLGPFTISKQTRCGNYKL